EGLQRVPTGKPAAISAWTATGFAPAVSPTVATGVTPLSTTSIVAWEASSTMTAVWFAPGKVDARSRAALTRRAAPASTWMATLYAPCARPATATGSGASSMTGTIAVAVSGTKTASSAAVAIDRLRESQALCLRAVDLETQGLFVGRCETGGRADLRFV